MYFNCMLLLPPMPLYKAGAQQGLFPYGCRESSFPAGVQQGLLSLLVQAVENKFPMATKQQNKTGVSKSMAIFVNQIWESTMTTRATTLTSSEKI